MMTIRGMQKMVLHIAQALTILCILLSNATALLQFKPSSLGCKLLKSQNGCNSNCTFDTEKVSVDGSQTVTIAKSMMGIGALSLPYAADRVFSATESSIAYTVPFVLCAVCAALSANAFLAVEEASSSANSTISYAEAFVSSVYPLTVTSSLREFTRAAVDLMMILKCLFSSFAYMVVMQQTLASTFGALGLTNAVALSRLRVLLPPLILMPICLPTSLSFLAPLSMAGVLGLVYLASYMSYTAITRHDAAARVGVPPLSPSLLSSIAFMLSALSSGFLAHHNAPRFAAEMRLTTKTSALPVDAQHSRAVRYAFALSTAMYSVLMASGSAAYGRGQVRDNVLLSLPTGALIAPLIARLSVLLSVGVSFPFVFAPVLSRALYSAHSLTAMMKMTTTLSPSYSASSSLANDRVSLPTRAMVTMMSLFALSLACSRVQSLGPLVAASGALFGSLIVYVLPGIMQIAMAKTSSSSSSLASSKNMKMLSGILMVLFGSLTIIVNLIAMKPTLR